ncbi:MAG: transcriptional regulator [Solirubrobacterales bacterium]|nr:transcriptional regulator [Solirubrobacterales bacterium]
MVREEGIERLTMRRIANRCGVSTMTLYRHVRTKEELLQALANTYFEEIVLPSPVTEPDGPPWDVRIADLYREVRRVYHQYPELGAIAAKQPVDGMGAFRGAEVVLACLAEGGVTGARAIAVFDALGLFATSFAQREIAETPEIRAARAARMLVLPREEFPHLRRTALAMADRTQGEHFDEALEAILDGVRSRKPRRGRS